MLSSTEGNSLGILSGITGVRNLLSPSKVNFYLSFDDILSALWVAEPILGLTPHNPLQPLHGTHPQFQVLLSYFLLFLSKRCLKLAPRGSAPRIYPYC